MDGARLAGDRTLELVLEAGDEHPAAELDHLIAPAPAVERLAVDHPLEVDDEQIARARGPGDGVGAGEALAQRLELGVDRVGLDLGLAAPDLQALVRPEPAAGRTPISIENVSAPPSAGEPVTSRLGWPTNAIPASSSAVRHQRFSPSWTALSTTASRPGAASRSAAGPCPCESPRRAGCARAGGRALERTLDLLGRDLGDHADAALGKLGDVVLMGGPAIA